MTVIAVIEGELILLLLRLIWIEMRFLDAEKVVLKMLILVRCLRPLDHRELPAQINVKETILLMVI